MKVLIENQKFAKGKFYRKVKGEKHLRDMKKPKFFYLPEPPRTLTTTKTVFRRTSCRKLGDARYFCSFNGQYWVWPLDHSSWLRGRLEYDKWFTPQYLKRKYGVPFTHPGYNEHVYFNKRIRNAVADLESFWNVTVTCELCLVGDHGGYTGRAGYVFAK